MLRRLRKLLTRRYYLLGLIYKDAPVVHWLRFAGHKSNWLADPFILSVNENDVVLFAEEIDAQSQKGRLVRIVVDRRRTKILEKTVILELDTHLSFPIIFRENGNVYVYPENYESNSFKIYTYNAESCKLENPVELIHEPLLDAQIVKIENSYYVFAVKYQDGTQEDTKHLMIYKSPSLLGPYNLIQSIHNDKCEERGAGEVFSVNNKWIRPAQCCEGDYGKSVIFYELVKDGDSFSEKEVGRYLPYKSYPEGLHTYNCMNSVAVVDGNAYFCGNIISIIKNLIR